MQTHVDLCSDLEKPKVMPLKSGVSQVKLDAPTPDETAATMMVQSMAEVSGWRFVQDLSGVPDNMILALQDALRAKL